MSKIDLIMTEGIQKYILHERELLDIMTHDTKNTQWAITNRDVLPKMPPPILYYYFEKASQQLANRTTSMGLPTNIQTRLTNLVDINLIKNMVTEVIQNNNIFKSQYIDVIGSVYPDSLKIFNNFGYEIPTDIVYDGAEITENLPVYAIYNCKKTQFMDLITEIISTNLVFSESKMDNINKFQYIVNTFFNTIKDEYIRQINDPAITKDDIIFTYKGGTVMKILFERHKDLYTTSEFNDIFRDYFKRSDSDYSFIINYNLDKNVYNKIYYHITKLSIYTFKYLKKIFLDNKEFILGIDINNNDDLQEILFKINEKLEKIKNLQPDEKLALETTSDCGEFLKIDKFIGVASLSKEYFSEKIPDLQNNDIYLLKINKVDNNLNINDSMKNFVKNKKITTRRNDFLITKQNINKNESILINNLNIDKNFLDKNSYLYISANETPYGITQYTNDADNKPLGATKNTFFLTRIKINIVFYYKTIDNKYGYIQIPSELIDLSISKQISTDLILSYKNMVHKYNNYKYIYEDGIDKIDIIFLGYSPNGFISDLNKVFFYENKYPWHDAKFNKRLYRLCYFLVLTLKEKKIKLSNFIVLMLDYINSILTNLPDIQNKFDLILKYFAKTGLTTTNFAFAESVIFMNNNFIKTPVPPVEISKFNEFFNTLKDIFEKIQKIENNKFNISEFSISNFKIPGTNPKTILLEQLGGYEL